MTILYAKLVLRSINRSWRDYGIHFFTLTLLFSMMSVSNLISAAGRIQAGFETAALPLLITLLSLLLLHDCNRSLLVRRARELALYLLLGMERDRLSLLFFLEGLLLGLLSLAAGFFLGFVLFPLFFSHFTGLAGGSVLPDGQLLRAGIETAGYFLLIETLSLALLFRTFRRLELRDLLNRKRENQPLDARLGFWCACAGGSFSVLLTLLAGFALLPEERALPLVSVISLPLLLLVFSFYRAFFAFCSRLRALNGVWRFRGDRLYLAGRLLSRSRSEAMLNSVLCLCLMFSSMSFVAGGAMLRPEILTPDSFHQRWMGFLQLCICVIFMILYFAVLSLGQMTDLQRERSSLRLLWHLGKSRKELRRLMARRLRQKFDLPLLLWGILLVAALILAGGRVDALLCVPWLTFRLSADFLAGFIVLYGLYFCLVYRASAVYLEHILPPGGE